MTSTLNLRPSISIGRITLPAASNRRRQWSGLAVLGVACVICATATAEPPELVGWRGAGSGQYRLADPVTSWSADQNVLWKTEVGKGNSTPVVVGSRVF